jgi:hypothetical protein
MSHQAGAHQEFLKYTDVPFWHSLTVSALPEIPGVQGTAFSQPAGLISFLSLFRFLKCYENDER